MKNLNKSSILFIVAIIILVAATRILLIGDGNSFSSYTPMGAICLFCGAYFNRKWWAFALPLAVLILSDVVINSVIYEGKYGIISSGSFLTYGIMMAIVLIGTFLYSNKSIKNIALGAVSSTLLFWMVMDFAVWAGGGLNIITGLPLSRDFAGLIQAYVQGIPFAQNFFVGTAAYSALLFGAYELAKQRFNVLKVA